MAKIPHDPNEIVAVVNEKDRVMGSVTRGEVHKKGILHREVIIYLINPLSKQILLQKRLGSHKWDHSSAGHFPHDQSYEKAAEREFEEELGIKLSFNSFKELAHREMRKELASGEINNRFVKIFLVEKDIPLGKFNFDKGEIEGIKYFTKKELSELIQHPEQITSAAVEVIHNYILKLI